MVGIEEDRLISTLGGSISEVSGILEISDAGLRLCRFGQEVFQALEKEGPYLVIADPGVARNHRLRRLPEKPPDLTIEPLLLPPPMPLPETRVRSIEIELARRLDIDQKLVKPRAPFTVLPTTPPMTPGKPGSNVSPEDEGLLLALETTENTRYIRALVLNVGWIDAGRFSFDAANAAFLLVQHSGDIPLMLGALPWIEADAEHGRTDWEPYALLFDRLQLTLGKRQRYGTQLRRDESGRFEVLPVEDERRLDEIRSKAGLMPLAQYIKIFGALEVRLSSACALTSE